MGKICLQARDRHGQDKSDESYNGVELFSRAPRERIDAGETFRHHRAKLDCL